MVVKKNNSISVVPAEIISRMIKVIDGKGPADLARDLSVSVNNFSNWKVDGVSLRMVVRFSEKHEVSLDWLLYGKGRMKLIDIERGGSWIGLEGLSREQREIIEMISRDRIFARSFMMMYETIVSRYREVIEPTPPFPVKEPGPEVGIAEKK